MNDSDSANQTRPRVPLTEDTARVRGPYSFLSPAQSADEIGRFADYRVQRLLGSGGMGLVFAAEELALRRPVALKVLKPELASDPESRERFLREARAAAEITSDYAVTVLRVGETSGLPYLVMPLLRGESLQSRIEGSNGIDLRTALVIARDTAAGLAAAHAKGLIHRDIKPANIWLEPTDAVECDTRAGTCGDSSAALGRPPKCLVRAKLLDFGLARKPMQETSLTSTGFIVGTPNYMSPEQASGAEVDPRADLFALGSVLYVMLTGELPFRGPSAMAVMMALANRNPDPVRAKNPAVPPPVSDLVAKLLAKRPDDRVQTASEVVCALEASIADLSGIGAALPPAPPARHQLPTEVTPAAPASAPVPPGRVTRRRAMLAGAALTLAVVGGSVLAWKLLGPAPAVAPEPIAVGVLHSQSGTMAVSENPVIDATLLAIDEVNASGGVNGRQLRAVVVDGRSDPDEFARQAEHLLLNERCKVVFGCWTSAARKSVRPALERNGGLLLYPVHYEGLEESPRIVYLGPAPNQQLIPAVDFIVDRLGKKRIAFVGADYIYPHTAHQIILDRVKERNKDGAGVEVVAQTFLPVGATDASAALVKARIDKADVVINTINGASNAALFRALRGPSGLRIPSVSVSITENEVRGLDPEKLTDDYLVASYFQAVDRPESRAFVQKVHAKYGADRPVSDSMAAAYSGVHLWAKAARLANSAEPDAVLAQVRGLEFDAPGARIKVDPENLHAWRPVRVGKVQPDGTVALVPGAGTEVPQRPIPFPPTRTRDQWNGFLHRLEMEWGGKWQAPDKK